MTSVKVAVRVRPFNQRPEEQSSTCIIDMVDNQTTITNPVRHKVTVFYLAAINYLRRYDEIVTYEFSFK